MAEMNPADVPDELTAAGFDAIRAWWKAHPDPNCHLDDRTMMREVLAAVLPLHEKQLRAELDRTRAELSARIEAESADVAAGSYAGRAEAAESERNEQRTRATIAEAAATALRGQRNAAKDRAEQAEAEVARLRKANVATAAEYDAALLAIHEARDHWQERAAAEFERAEQAEAALAEMQREFGVINAEWGVQWPNHNATKKIGEGEARAIVRNDRAATLRRRLVGEWQDYKPEPRTVLERAADEQGVRLPVDIGKFTAGADLQLTDEEFAEWTSAWQCTAPCCSEDVVEQVVGGNVRQEWDGFLTDEDRRKVAEFMAEAAQGGDDIDIDAVIVQNHADAHREYFGNEQGDGEGGGA